MRRGRYFFIGFVFMAVLSVSASVYAQSKPVQLSLFTPVQIFDESIPISGVRLSLIYGRSVSVSGLDWGFVNHTTTGDSKGVQFGFVALVEADYVGWQNCVVNIVKNDFEGFQWGAFNSANYVNGLQLGFVNYAGTMKGLQIGIVNIIDKGGQFPVFPIINWSF